MKEAHYQLCYITIWCEWRDSNPQARRREILSLLCIPFHHTHFNWCPRSDSNWHCMASKTTASTNWATRALLAPLPGFEPGSCFACSRINSPGVSPSHHERNIQTNVNLYNWQLICCATLIRNHFAQYTLGLVVRSDRWYLLVTVLSDSNR